MVRYWSKVWNYCVFTEFKVFKKGKSYFGILAASKIVISIIYSSEGTLLLISVALLTN